MPDPVPYNDGTPTIEQGGRQSLVLVGGVIPYSAHTVKAIWINTAGTVSGFKLNDDTTGTARDWICPAGVYLIGPFRQITAAPADAIAELD